MLENNLNWREVRNNRKEKKLINWEIGLYKEFIEFVDEASKLAKIYDWDFWGGGTDNYAVTLSQSKMNGKKISLRMIGCDDYAYYVSFYNEMNPNNIELNKYEKRVGKDMLEAIKYLKDFLHQNIYIREFNEYPRIQKGFGYDKCFKRLSWIDPKMANQYIEERFNRV